jgi:hypothetical protein
MAVKGVAATFVAARILPENSCFPSVSLVSGKPTINRFELALYPLL